MNVVRPISREGADEVKPVGPQAAQQPAPGSARTARRRRGWLLLIVLLAAAAGIYAYRDVLTHEEASSAPPPVAPTRLSAMEVATINPATLSETIKISGSLAPIRETTVTSRVAGHMLTVSVQPGDRVAGDAVIAELDTADLLTRVEQQQATIAATQAQLDYAQRQLESTRALADKGLASPSALENMQSTADALRANLAAQQAALASIRISLDNAKIRAPFDGIVSTRNVEPGQTVAVGSSIATVVDLTSMEGRVYAPLGAAASLRVGQPARLSVEGFNDRAFDAAITRINPVAVDGTRSIQVYLTLGNADGLLRGGMFVTGTIVLDEKPDALAVPDTALRHDKEGDYVLVVREGKLERDPVTPGKAWNDGRLVELGDTLQPGSAVVTAALPELEAGIPVVIED